MAGHRLGRTRLRPWRIRRRQPHAFPGPLSCVLQERGFCRFPGTRGFGRRGGRDGLRAPYLPAEIRRSRAFDRGCGRAREGGGEGAFAEFGERGSRWFGATRYFCVHGENGVCVVHPVSPHWVGRDLSGASSASCRIFCLAPPIWMRMRAVPRGRTLYALWVSPKAKKALSLTPRPVME